MDENGQKREKLQRKKSMHAVKRLLPYYKPYIGILIFDLFCAAMTTVCELVLPMLVRKITNAATSEPMALTMRLILTSGGLYVLLRFIDAAAMYYMNSRGHIMGTRMETDMRRDLFAHLQKLSFSYYNNAKVGVLMSRITNDLFDVTEFAHHCPEEFFIAFIKIIGSFVILCTVNIPLTLMIFAVFPVMVIVMYRFNRRLKDAQSESRRRIGELNATVEDSLLGIHVVKSFAGEEKEKQRFDIGNLAYLDIKSKMYKLMGAFQGVSRLFDGIMYILTVIVGSIFILKGRGLNAADLIAYLMYVTTLFASVRSILQFTEQFYRGITGIERFIEIMDVEPDIKDAPDAKTLVCTDGEIVFDNVTFTYGEGEKEVLRNFSLTVNKGEQLAVVGPSGAGKTTLCALIPRFYEPVDGKIFIDGSDITAVTLSSLRSCIGTVEQDVYLFSGSVRDNIAYGRDGATDDEIRKAASLAGALDFIEELPSGFDTYVGERGVKLSGGQKQRIAIARVFLKDPPILILDEATSALDNESERIVRDSLSRLAEGRTTVTIAHRLTTVKNCDRIIVLTENGIAEEGTHAELMEKGGIYSDMYKLYSDV